jgi:hypothetical protein
LAAAIVVIGLAAQFGRGDDIPEIPRDIVEITAEQTAWTHPMSAASK